jgi:hypothetical protein
LRRLALLAVLLITAIAVARVMLPSLVEGWLVATLRDEVGIDLDVDDIDLDLWNDRAVVTGIRCRTLG